MSDDIEYGCKCNTYRVVARWWLYILTEVFGRWGATSSLGSVLVTQSKKCSPSGF